MKLKGFTLAEVLITLAIIGIVAALTIPSVISNYQQQEFKTGLKKAVSVLNEAIQTNIIQDGETPYENSDLFSYLQRHMSVTKKENASFDGDIRKNNAFYTTDGMRFEFGDSNTWSSYGNIILHESGLQYGYNGIHRKYVWNLPFGPSMGTIVTEPISSAKACGSYGLANNLNGTTNPPCLIMVDVNGDKKPSVYASNIVENAYIFPSVNDKKITDVFNILITEEKAIPFGVVAQRAMYSK